MKCAKCDGDLPGNSEFVACSTCEKKYHYDCSVRETKWRNMSADSKGRWSCATCKGSGYLSRVNSATSGLGDSDGTAEEDLTTRALLVRMNSRLDTLDEVKRNVDGLSKAMSFFNEKYEELLNETKENRKLNLELKKEVETLKSACEKKDKDLSDLARRVNSLEQYGRGANLEVHGLAVEHPNEQDVVLKIAEALQLPYDGSQVQAAHRLGSQGRNGRPPTLLIQFVNKATKLRWLLEGRRRKLCSKDIVGVGGERVYFNENLTPFYGKLYKEARKLAREKGYEEVWVLNGTIRMKKRKTDKRTYIINDSEDLERLVT